MPVFDPYSRHLREVLISCSHLKKITVQACRILLSTYGEALFAEDSCQTKVELAESLRVTQQAISKRLKAI